MKSLLNKRLAATEVKPSDTLKGTKDATKTMDSSEYAHSSLAYQNFYISYSPNLQSCMYVLNSAQNQMEKEKLLAELNNKVRYVYEQCGFDASSKPNTLFMLSQMESKLEVLLQVCQRLSLVKLLKIKMSLRNCRYFTLTGKYIRRWRECLRNM